MTHKEIITSINKLFKNSTFNTNIDVKKSIAINGPHIDIKYIPEAKEKITIAKAYNGGLLRIYIYEKTPADVMDTMDGLITLLDDKIINEIYFEQFLVGGSAQRTENGDYFTTFIDFDVKTCSSY